MTCIRLKRRGYSMRHSLISLSMVLLLAAAGCSEQSVGLDRPDAGNGGSENGDQEAPRPQAVTLHEEFTEDFSEEVSGPFDFIYRTTREDFRFFSGVPSYTERNTDILMLRIDPADQAGADRGAVVLSRDYTFYGTYSARIRVPDIRKAQPDVAAIVDFSVNYEDPSFGYNEISIEWRIADPTILYLRTVTGVPPVQNKLVKTVNLADGTVYEAIYSSKTVQKNGTSVVNFTGDLAGTQNGPADFSPLTGFDASSRFYIYGFDWYPDRITWWVQYSDIDNKIVLWDYEAADLFPDSPSSTGIPVIPSRYRLNFWHSKISPAEGNPASVEAPLYPYELEVDRVSYEPFDDLNNAWLEETAALDGK